MSMAAPAARSRDHRTLQSFLSVTWLVSELAKRVHSVVTIAAIPCSRSASSATRKKSQVRMMTRALLLLDKAKAGNKPQIIADDVTCGHAATSGALNDTVLFYPRARGLPEKEAQRRHIQPFGGQAIEEIADAGLREFMNAQIAPWLEARP